MSLAFPPVLENERSIRVVKVEYSEALDYPAAAVFAALIDIEARATWQPALIEVRITPPGPAQLGSSIFEVGKFSGYKSEKTMMVSFI